MNDSEQKPQKKITNKSKAEKRKIKHENIEEPKIKKVTLLVPDDAPEFGSKKRVKKRKNNTDVENTQNTENKLKKKANRNFISEEKNENEENCIQKPHNNKTRSKRQSHDSPILYDYENEDESPEKPEIKKEKQKKNSSKKNNKNSKNKNHSLFSTKMKSIISKIESPEKMRQIFFYKWICFTFDVKKGEEEEVENEEEEEEIEEEENEKKEKKNGKNYKIPKTQYIVVHQENNDEEQEEENDESNENNNGYLEEIEERAPDEEESAISSVKNKKILMKFNNQIIGMRKILKFKNILYYYFKRWKNITKTDKKINTTKKNNKNEKKNTDIKNNKNNLKNEDDPKTKKIKNNLKNFIELGGTTLKIEKKYINLWKQTIKKSEKQGQTAVKSTTNTKTENKNIQSEPNKRKITKKKQLPKKIYTSDENTNNNNSQEEPDIAKSYDIIDIKKVTIMKKTAMPENDNEKPRKFSAKISINKKNNNIDLAERIDIICNKHKQNKLERSLNIDLPRSKKNSDLYNLDNRKSFSNLNSTMSDEETDNKLLNLLKIASCKKNPLMNSFDKWFDLTYSSKKYTPFIRKKSTNKKKSTALKSHSKNANEEKNNIDKKQKKGEIKARFITDDEIKEEPKAKFGEAEIIKPKTKLENKESPLLFATDEKIKQNCKSETSIKKQRKIKEKKNKVNGNNNNKKNDENNNNQDLEIPISSSVIISPSPDLLFNTNNDIENNTKISTSESVKLLSNKNNNNANVNTLPRKKSKLKKSKPKNIMTIEKNNDLETKNILPQNNNKNDSDLQNLENKNNQNPPKKLPIADDSPRQKKPGGKVKFENKENEEKKDNAYYENYGKDSSLDLKALANMVFEQEEELSEESPVQTPVRPKKKKHKKKSLSKNHSAKNMTNQPKEKKSNKNTVSKSAANIQNPEEENNNGNDGPVLEKIHYFKGEINPDVENIEIYQDDEPEEVKPKKKHRRSKRSSEDENNENPLIKKFKRAMHLLRKVIRSFTKRQKQLSTFNPDFELENFFKKWFKNIFNNEPKKNQINYGDFITPDVNDDDLQENEAKEKQSRKKIKEEKPQKRKKSNKEKKTPENKETQKKNKILKIINIVETHRKKYKARLSEDEENENDKKWCWKTWCNNCNSNLQKKESKKNSNNNMNIEENEEDDDEDNIYEMQQENPNLKNSENEKQTGVSEVYINTEKNKTLPYIYNLNKIENKIKNKTINIMSKTPDNLYKNIYPETFIEILKYNNQRIITYRIFSFYSLFTENVLFYILRKYFNIWRKKTTFTSSLKDKHIKCSNCHCLKCNCEYSKIHCPGCLFDDNIRCLNCECDKAQTKFKKLLIKHKYLKEMYPKKYYFICWMKTKNGKK